MGKFLAALLLLLPVAGLAHTVAVIGTGDVASALGPEFAAQGHEVTYGSRKPASEAAKKLVEATSGAAKAVLPAAAVQGADIVVLAVPASVVVSVAQSLGDLSGKILIDPTNAFRFTEDKLVEAVLDTPVALSLQEAVPNAHVVKAFHLLNYRVMIDPQLAGGPMTIPMVGDSAEAKATVAALAEGMGFHTMDLGPVRYAKELEGLLILWFNARLSGQPFNYYLRPEPTPAN